MSGIGALLGKTLTAVERDRTSIAFTTNEGAVYKMHHHQDCCESVYIEDIVGNLSDLIGSPILRAEERTQDEPDEYGTSMWTFYELAGIRGSVTIRWMGSSNGYYSVGVDVEQIKQSQAEAIEESVEALIGLAAGLRRVGATNGQSYNVQSWEADELATHIETVLGRVV